MSTHLMAVDGNQTTAEGRWGKLHFKASNSATDLNIVSNTGSNMPSSQELSVWINGVQTSQLYNSLTFSAGDDVQIRLKPYKDVDGVNPTHFGSGRFFPVMSFYNKNYVAELYEYPADKTNANTWNTNNGNTFQNNTNLMYIAPRALYKLKKCVYFGYSYATYGIFRRCTSITSIPSGLFDKNTNVTDFESTFNGCTSITSIPSGLFDKNTNVTNFESTFNGCTSITSIPSGLFDNCPNVTTFMQLFTNCTSLTGAIPTGLFDNCPNVQYFSWTFMNCAGLTSIPAGLFDNCTKVKYFWLVFGGCTGLTSIPAGLFDNCTEATNFAQAFEKCTNITAIPSGLFDGCTKVTSFNATFNGCSNLTSIPAHLFDNCPDVTNFGYTFPYCKITSIPNGLFDNNTKVTTFEDCFISAKITSIPAHLFDNCPNVLSFHQCFYGCNSLLSVPDDLFRYNTKVTGFAWVFAGTGITSIPQDLFRYNTAVTKIFNAFNWCSSLQDFELYIGSEVISNASNFCLKDTRYTRIIHVKAGSTTETTFNNVASSLGLTIISDM